ncbi:MAG: flavodoxin family protein [Clostridia bacterium]|nr:flavodoxin family protein [Clostridia bacterium]
MKNVLIISSSPRKNGNSELLCKEFYEGAVEAGHNAELVRLAEKQIGYCKGCYVCRKRGKCVQDDDMMPLLEKIKAADVLVLASPVYFYSMTAQLKTFIDRLFYVYREVHADIYIIVTAHDTDEPLLEQTAEAIRGCTRDCFEDCEEKGCLIVGGVGKRGEVIGREEMETAFEMGRNC